MNIAIMVPPRDFRDETVSTAIRLLEKWGVTTLVASGSLGDCEGYHGARLKSVVLMQEVTTENFAGIFLSDGPGVDEFKLYDARHLLDVIKHFNDKGLPIACVGNAVKILARANVISKVRIARVDDSETKRLAGLFRGVMTDNGFEAQENILTAGDNEHVVEVIDAMLDRLGVR
ncbi:MAG: DJ-1/PfpI family protein [Candidatus Marsarchaeota archaeon]|jgi:putative intracellular protease/amidase|nr:DJ-1/PfpI family protein [Candidatus Marsarchaeota archaeon]